MCSIVLILGKFHVVFYLQAQFIIATDVLFLTNYFEEPNEKKVNTDINIKRCRVLVLKLVG